MCAMSGELGINLGAIKLNYAYIDGLSASTCETACAVKADAYGLGAKHVAPALYDAGARSFFVATLDEAIEVQTALVCANIYVLGGFSWQNRSIYKQYGLIPVLNSLDEIALYKSYALEEGRALPSAVHFDTGMSRLGLGAGEAAILCDDMALLDGLDLALIMSHFVSSEEAGNPLNNTQYEKFKQLASHFPTAKRSLCNSGGVFLNSDYHFDLARTGIALYGGNPSDSLSANPMQPVVSLDAPVLQIKSVKQGETAGYNGVHVFAEDTNVAIISIGYADGLLRTLSSNGAFYWQGHRLPICGRVSMDTVICDLANVPKGDYPNMGDMVEIIGKSQTIDDLAAAAGTISYEILTSLGTRYKRTYF